MPTWSITTLIIALLIGLGVGFVSGIIVACAFVSRQMGCDRTLSGRSCSVCGAEAPNVD